MALGPPVKMIKKVTTISLAFAIVGFAMAWTAFAIEQTQFAPLANEYFAENTKTERDSAAAGSQLAQDHAEIETLKPTILTLKLVGVATLLFGILVALLGIFRMLSLMPVGLADTMKAAFDNAALGKK